MLSDKIRRGRIVWTQHSIFLIKQIESAVYTSNRKKSSCGYLQFHSENIVYEKITLWEKLLCMMQLYFMMIKIVRRQIKKHRMREEIATFGAKCKKLRASLVEFLISNNSRSSPARIVRQHKSDSRLVSTNELANEWTYVIFDSANFQRTLLSKEEFYF